MRLHELVTGKKIWAGASITKRQDGRVVRINAPSPTGKASLTQRQIARWPHAVRGLALGAAVTGSCVLRRRRSAIFRVPFFLCKLLQN